MRIPLRKALGFGLIAVVSVLAVTPPAWSDDDKKNERRGHRERRDDRRDHRDAHRDRAREQHREWERRHHRHDHFDRHRAAAYWRFERNRGWRWEHRPGFWSPFFVWWAIEGRPLLRPYPTTRIVRYPTGYYELVGDGITTAFYWVWRPTVVVAAPPLVPVPPAMPPGYELPAGYPPPPTS